MSQAKVRNFWKLTAALVVIALFVGGTIFLVHRYPGAPYQPWTGKVIGEQTEHSLLGGARYYLIIRADSDGQPYTVDVDISLSVCAVGTKVTVSRTHVAGC